MTVAEAEVRAAAARTVRLGRLPVPSLRAVWVLLVLVGTFAGPASMPLSAYDVQFTIRMGDWIWTHRAIPSVDPLTSAPQLLPQMDGQWLAQVVTYGLYRLGGPGLLQLGVALSVSTTFGLLILAASTFSGRPRISSAAALVGFALSITNLAARAQSFAYPFFALFLVAVARAERRGDRRLLWVLPAASALWANVHGSFFLGPLLLGCVWVSTVWEARSLRAGGAYLATLVGTVVGCCVTPFGPGSLLYVRSITSNTIIRSFVTEWAPSSTVNWEGRLLFLSLLLLGAVALRSRIRLRVWEVLMLLAVGWMALTSLRTVAWWGMLLVPILARLAAGIPFPRRLAQAERPGQQEKPALNLLIATMLLAIAASSLPWVKAGLPFLPADRRVMLETDAPTDAAAFLAGHSYPGLLFNHQAWGGYLDEAVWPKYKPFVDGRIELHPTDVWLDYLRIMEPSANWQALLAKYGVGILFLDDGSEHDLETAVRGSPLWRQVYDDGTAAIFVRSEAPPGAATPS